MYQEWSRGEGISDPLARTSHEVVDCSQEAARRARPARVFLDQEETATVQHSTCTTAGRRIVEFAQRLTRPRKWFVVHQKT